MTTDENQFNTTSRSEPDADSGANSISVVDQNEYTFLTDTYQGIGGYRNGLYLESHDREMFYKSRQRYSHYVNFTRPIIRAMVEPVFTDPVNREYGNNPLFEAFMEDVNHDGLHLQRFTYLVAETVRLHSVTFIVMDNAEEQPQGEQDAISTQAYPYVYIRKADQVRGYDVDMFGRLIWILFDDQPVKVEVNGKIEEEKRFRYWDKEQTYLMKLKNDTDIIDEQYEIVPGTERLHGLGRLPVEVIYDSEKDDYSCLLVHSKMYGIGRLNHAIYNKDSEMRDLERNQGFCVLIYPYEGGEKTLQIGSKNVLFFPKDATNQPDYISPDPELLEGLAKQREVCVKDLFALAEQNGVIGVTKEAKSGLALSFEFQAYESTLQKTSEIATDIENRIAGLFQAWTNTTFEYEVYYPDEFKPNQLLEKVAAYDTITMMPNISRVTMKRIAVDIHKTLFPDAEENELRQVELEYDEQIEIDEQRKAAEMENMNNEDNEEQTTDEE